jgi:hypothetical protein
MIARLSATVTPATIAVSPSETAPPKVGAPRAITEARSGPKSNDRIGGTPATTA